MDVSGLTVMLFPTSPVDHFICPLQFPRAVSVLLSPLHTAAFVAEISNGSPPTTDTMTSSAKQLTQPSVRQVAVYFVVLMGCTWMLAPNMPFDQMKFPVQPVAVRVTVSPKQTLVLLALTTGVGGIVTVIGRVFDEALLQLSF